MQERFSLHQTKNVPAYTANIHIICVKCKFFGWKIFEDKSHKRTTLTYHLFTK
jgi:hypothetical protein